MSLKELKLKEFKILTQSQQKHVVGGEPSAQLQDFSNCHGTSYQCASGGGVRQGISCPTVVNGIPRNVVYEVNGGELKPACQ